MAEEPNRKPNKEFTDRVPPEYRAISTELKRQADLSIYCYLAHLEGVTDEDIAKKIGCSLHTVSRHRNKMSEIGFIQNMRDKLFTLTPLLFDSVMSNLKKHKEATQNKMLEGLNVYVQKVTLDTGITQEQARKAFEESVGASFGKRLKDDPFGLKKSEQGSNRVTEALKEDKDEGTG